MKLIVIGAGIAGLTLGLACQRAGMEVKIYDSARALETIGGGIFLWPHGLRFLDSLGLVDCLQSSWMSVNAMTIRDHRGQAIFHEKHAELYSLLDGEILPIDRSQLQQLLLSELMDDMLTLNRTCVRVENHADYARVYFADGSYEDADLIAGADGINSAVRASLFPRAKTQYSGFCWWGGIVAHASVPHFAVDEAQYILGRGKLCSIWPTHGERFMWYLPVKLPLADFIAGGDGREQARQLCAGWHEDVMRIINAPQTAQQFHLPIYQLAPGNFSAGRTVLLGDAASAFGPLLGQGANKAIEDAYVLATLLQNCQEIPEVLYHYEHARRARHQRLFDLEQMAADAMMHETDDALQFFEEQLAQVDLAFMYQDMIPLVNLAGCEEVQSAVTRIHESSFALQN